MPNIDSSIYFQQQQVDPVARMSQGLESGMRMGELMRQRKMQDAQLAKEQQFRDTLSQGLDEAGQIKPQTMSQLMSIDPEKAYGLRQRDLQMQQTKSQLDASDLKRQREELGLIANVAGSITDQGTYERGLQVLQQAGVNTSNLPLQYDPDLVKTYQGAALTAMDRFNQSAKNRELQLRENEARLKQQQSLAANKSFGKAPTGYRFKDDGTLEPIPGGPIATKQVERKKEEVRKASQVVQDIGRTIKFAEGSALAAGAIGSYTKDIPGTPAWELKSYIDNIKPNLAFETLQAMREASPTGGALGSVSERELDLLQNAAGKISPDMPRDMLIDNLKRLSNQYNDIVHGPDGGPKRYQLSFDDQGRRSSNVAQGDFQPLSRGTRPADQEQRQQSIQPTAENLQKAIAEIERRRRMRMNANQAGGSGNGS